MRNKRNSKPSSNSNNGRGRQHVSKPQPARLPTPQLSTVAVAPVNGSQECSVQVTPVAQNAAVALVHFAKHESKEAGNEAFGSAKETAVFLTLGIVGFLGLAFVQRFGGTGQSAFVEKVGYFALFTVLVVWLLQEQLFNVGVQLNLALNLARNKAPSPVKEGVSLLFQVAVRFVSAVAMLGVLRASSSVASRVLEMMSENGGKGFFVDLLEFGHQCAFNVAVATLFVNFCVFAFACSRKNVERRHDELQRALKAG